VYDIIGGADRNDLAGSYRGIRRTSRDASMTIFMCMRYYCRRGLGVTAAVLVLAGCSTFSPRYSIPPRASTIDAAQQQIETSIADLERSVHERSAINGVTGVGALIGAAGAALSPVFKGSRDLTVGLAAFGAANYAVNSVYANRTVTGVLGSGIDALQCVSTAAGGAVDAHREISTLVGGVTRAETALDARMAVIDDPKNPVPIPADQRQSAGHAKAQADTALQSANARGASETEIAGQISSAVQKILGAVNAQVQSALPDIAAIMRAGSGISTSALASMATQDSTPPGAVPVKAAGGPAIPRDVLLDDRIAQLSGAIMTLTAALGRPGPSFNSDACKVADMPATAPMATDAPASVDLKFDSPVLGYKITGGSGYYNAHWIGAEPADVVAAMQADTLRIFVRQGTKAAGFDGKAFQLDVYDSTAGTPKHLPKPITLNTTK
jgi:hypothetical protein